MTTNIKINTCVLLQVTIVTLNKLDPCQSESKLVRKSFFWLQGACNSPKFHYALLHYIIAHCPLAHCSCIYNSMNYESVSFHRSWNSLPDVQITLRQTITSRAKLVHSNQASNESMQTQKCTVHNFFKF